MKNLRHLSEITTRYGTRNINELEFDSPEDFAAYKKKHKLRPGTVVKVAGKDKKIGGDEAPKGKKPKGDTTADTLTKGLKDGGLNPYKDGPMINQALDDIGGDHSELKKRIDTYGDNVPSSKGKSEAEYQREIDKYKEEGEKLSNDIADAVSDKPKGKRMQITMDFNNASREDLEGFAKKYDLKLGIVDNNPNYGLEAEFEGSEENLKKFMTSDDYGLDEKDFDDYAREYGDVLDDEPSDEPQSSNEAPVSGEPKVDKSEMEDILNATLDDVGFGEQDTSGLEDIIYTYEDDLKEAGVLDDVQDDLYIVQYINSDDPSNPEDIPYEERERAVDRIRGKFEQADIIAESVNNIRELSKITTRYNK